MSESPYDARECAERETGVEQRPADEGLAGDAGEWPEFRIVTGLGEIVAG